MYDKVAQETLQMAGELEDCRSQTKRLIHDIQQKDEEIMALKQALVHRTAKVSTINNTKVIVVRLTRQNTLFLVI